MWRAEVEKLYEEIIAACDSQAKATVMTEYVRFLADMNGYEALLNVRYPGTPEQVAQEMADLWEDKCITLCNEIHASAAQRKDSFLSVQATEGENAQECACVVSGEENGTKTYTLAFCQRHGFPFSMIDALTQGQDTAEAWTALRQIWNVEMNGQYSMLSAEMGANSALVSVEFAALNQWMTAREAVLNALYPENPELVQQSMTKLFMERVNLICR